MNITQQTRHESLLAVQHKRSARWCLIYEILAENEDMTAREIADSLVKSGVIPSNERNYTAPRLTEMKQAGIVEAATKRQCGYTGRTVVAWRLRKEVQKADFNK